MDDRLRESLSAMLDDEADELTVRRVLAQADSQALQAQWLRWQRMREHLQGQDQHWQDIDVRAGIWGQLEQATPERTTLPATTEAATRIRPIRGRGVASLAAMFVIALVVGFGAGQQWSTDDFAPRLAGAVEPAGEQPLAIGGVVPSVPLQNLDEGQWQQLSDYMLRHAQHNSVAASHGAVGFARVTSVSPGNP